MRDEFRTCLNEQLTTELLTECKRNVETGDVNSDIKIIVDILHRAGDSMRRPVHTTRYTQNTNRRHTTWWDRDCMDLYCFLGGMSIKCKFNLGHHYVICIVKIQMIYYVPVNIFVIHGSAYFVRIWVPMKLKIGRRSDM